MSGRPAPLSAARTGHKGAEGRASPSVPSLGRVLQAGAEEGSGNKSHQEGPVPTPRASSNGDREADSSPCGASVAVLILTTKICWGKNRQRAGLFRRFQPENLCRASPRRSTHGRLTEAQRSALRLRKAWAVRQGQVRGATWAHVVSGSRTALCGH